MKTEIKKKKRRPYRKHKTDIPNFVNRNLLMDRCIQSLTEMSGYSKDQIYKCNTRDCSWWRRLGVYILVQKMEWTQESAGKAFGMSASAVNQILDKFDKMLEEDQYDIRLVPYMEKLYNDIAL